MRKMAEKPVVARDAIGSRNNCNYIMSFDIFYTLIPKEFHDEMKTPTHRH